MSRKISSSTKKIVAVILLFGLLGLVIQIIGVVKNKDDVGEIGPTEEILVRNLETVG